MILVDTNIFIDFWNNPSEEITKIFAEEEIVICGIVRAELLHGAVSEKDFNNIVNLLNTFEELDMISSDWQLLGDYLYRLRKSGISVPISDAIIALIAIKNDVPVWTGDKHFSLIQKELQDLKIYEA